MKELPAGWAEVALASFHVQARAIDPGQTPDQKFTLYSVPSFEHREAEILTGSAIGSTKLVVEPDTVLLCKINPRINRVWVVGERSSLKTIASSEWIPLVPGASVRPEYLAYYLQQDSVREFLARNASGVGGSLMRVKPSILSQLFLRFPPLREQRRIVAEIEKQFTRLDAALNALQRAMANLKQCRSGAVEAAFAAYSSAPIRRLGELGEIVGGVTKGQKRRAGIQTRPVPYLRVANVQRGHLNLDHIKHIQATEDEIRSLRLIPGDVLLNEGGDRDKLGRGWIWEGQIAECVHQNHVFRVRLNPLLAVPKFISHYANHFGQKYFFEEGKQTTNLASINMTKLRALPIPSPPVAEQERLVAGLEDHLSLIDDLDHSADANLHRAARLRQAILKKAFEGKLVPQDPNDEPASVLLDRIRVARAHPTGRARALR